MSHGDGRKVSFPWISWGATVLTGFGLKLAYSRASVEELGWILAATAKAVGWLRGEALALVPGAGWAPPDGAYVIAPACAGVNFLVLALAVSVFGFVHRLPSGRARLAWWLGSLGGAWLFTVGVNALRIVAAVALYRLGPVGGLSAGQLHRLLGIVIYLGALWGIHEVLDRWTAPPEADGTGSVDRARATAGRPYIGLWWRRALVPALYLGVTVLVPLVHAVLRGGDGRTAEHAMIVTLITLTAAGALALAGRLRRRGRGRREAT